MPLIFLSSVVGMVLCPLYYKISSELALIGCPLKILGVVKLRDVNKKGPKYKNNQRFDVTPLLTFLWCPLKNWIYFI